MGAGIKATCVPAQPVCVPDYQSKIHLSIWYDKEVNQSMGQALSFVTRPTLLPLKMSETPRSNRVQLLHFKWTYSLLVALYIPSRCCQHLSDGHKSIAGAGRTGRFEQPPRGSVALVVTRSSRIQLALYIGNDN